MLHKLYEREDLLTQSCDKVVLIARTMESAKNSVAATCKTPAESQDVDKWKKHLAIKDIVKSPDKE